MKENSDLSNLFTPKAITNDLHEIWEHLWNGTYIIGADLTPQRRCPFIMENAFCLERNPFSPEAGTIHMYKVNGDPANKKIKLYRAIIYHIEGIFDYPLIPSRSSIQRGKVIVTIHKRNGLPDTLFLRQTDVARFQLKPEIAI